ncbi:MAG: endonuclease domain-containing protein [Candidatus Uhrbacteria bacterium]|nr:endonuclease domain-containing protein [Candidatus Uhrbacteria bacterium]
MKPIESPYKTFRFKDYSFDHETGEAIFHYSFDKEIQFEERLIFPLPVEGIPAGVDEALDRALFALHLMAGISYYKAYCPSEIIIESGVLTRDEAEFWNNLYTLGLGEFFYQNDLEFKDYIHFPFSDATKRSYGRAEGEGSFVAIGGGKDSLVTIELLRRVQKDFTMFALGEHTRIHEVAAAVGGDLVTVKRVLDPRLFELNAANAYNGHVPISAYIAFMSVVLAILHSKRDVILSNERSANFGNVVVQGVIINHQYSKSLQFESDFQAYLLHSITPDISYFSLLRPFSELKISEMFSKYLDYFDVFSSCNKNFKLTHDKVGAIWCGECPKCAFVFAMLSAFVEKDRLVKIFGDNLFDREDLLPLFRELLGACEVKPFECVGEPSEVVAAFELARRRGDFNETLVMKYFIENVLPNQNVELEIKKALEVSEDHLIPEVYSEVIA